MATVEVNEADYNALLKAVDGLFSGNVLPPHNGWMKRLVGGCTLEGEVLCIAAARMKLGGKVGDELANNPVVVDWADLMQKYLPNDTPATRTKNENLKSDSESNG